MGMKKCRRSAVVKDGQREFGFVNHGGKRRGAGRKPKGQRALVSHATRQDVASYKPVHVTIKLRRGLPSLRRKRTYAVLLRTLAAGSERFGLRL